MNLLFAILGISLRLSEPEFSGRQMRYSVPHQDTKAWGYWLWPPNPTPGDEQALEALHVVIIDARRDMLEVDRTKYAFVSSSLIWSSALSLAPMCSLISFIFLAKCWLCLALSSYKDGNKGAGPEHIQASFGIREAAAITDIEETQSLHCVELNTSEMLLLPHQRGQQTQHVPLCIRPKGSAMSS